MPPRDVGQKSGLQSFSEAISSSSDLELAAWQERGLAAPSAGGSVLVWTIMLVSAAAGIACGLTVWLAAWRALAPLRPSAKAYSTNPAILVGLGGMIALVIAGAVGLTFFQVLSRVGYRLKQRAGN